MSLGSKELFHSNLLAWFIDKYPDEVGMRFAAWTTAAPARKKELTRREDGDLDLIIQLAGHEAIVVENKVLSMPDEPQLDGYATGPVARLSGKPSLTC